MYIFRCEDSVDGIFTAVYDAWASRFGLRNVKIEVQSERNGCYNMELFAEYINVVTEEGKAAKVADAIRKKISEEAYRAVIYSAVSESPEKGNYILLFLELGFKIGPDVIKRISNESVKNIFQLHRYVGNELHFYEGFLRFIEVDSGILFAKYEPKADISGLIMPHFAERFPDENIIILDVLRKKAAFYEAGKEWFLAAAPGEIVKIAEICSDEESEFCRLWRTYFKSIAIEARNNPKLQRNMLRLRFRTYLTEFH